MLGRLGEMVNQIIIHETLGKETVRKTWACMVEKEMRLRELECG
jgi:hypothetical protein